MEFQLSSLTLVDLTWQPSLGVSKSETGSILWEGEVDLKRSSGNYKVSANPIAYTSERVNSCRDFIAAISREIIICFLLAEQRW
jgi:hypothetical protein